MTEEPERVQLTVITQEIDDSDDPPAALDRDASAGGGESSEGEGDIEIEHVGDESSTGGVHGLIPTSGNMGSITFDVRRRTLINIYQRTILEEFYRCGMTSASLMLNHLHTAAAEKTGLDVTVVKNWIRNRRRPTAVKSAEKFAEKIAHGSLPPVPTIPNVPSLASIGLPTSQLTTDPVSSASYSTQSSSVRTLAAHLLPDPKRICTDSSLSTSTSVPPPLQSQQHQQLPSFQPAVSIHQSPMTTPLQLHPSFTPPPQPIPTPNTSSSSSSSGSGSGSSNISSTSNGSTNDNPLLVKVRVSGSGESDFVEVEVPSLSYSSLLKSCSEELEVATHEIIKIRKLPNVWVRKDKDVQRMKEGQELEVIIKSGSATASVTPPPHMTTMLTVNPFSVSSATNNAFSLLTSVAASSSQQHGSASHSLGLRSAESDNGLLAALTNDGPVSMPELTNVGGSSSNSNQVNGLH